MTKIYEERARMMILRSALLKNNIVIKTETRAGPGCDQAEGNYPVN
jgi:hypothetical protein